MYFEQFYVCCPVRVSYMDRFRGCGGGCGILQLHAFLYSWPHDRLSGKRLERVKNSVVQPLVHTRGCKFFRNKELFPSHERKESGVQDFFYIFLSPRVQREFP
jgi:hypothetical protein